MNQKIKELALKAHNPYSDFDHDLFAKLIIEEVIKIMADPKTYNRCTHTNFDLDRAQCVVQEISKKIYEEFL
jgi:hypothetical protein